MVENTELLIKEIANGDKIVTVQNFRHIYNNLPGPDKYYYFLEDLGGSLLDTVQKNIYITQKATFVKNPEKFSLKIVPGDKKEQQLDFIKKAQMNAKALTGVGIVSKVCLDFVVEENKKLVEENNDLHAELEYMKTVFEDTLKEVKMKFDIATKKKTPVIDKQEEELELSPRQRDELKEIEKEDEEDFEEEDTEEEEEDEWMEPSLPK